MRILDAGTSRICRPRMGPSTSWRTASGRLSPAWSIFRVPIWRAGSCPAIATYARGRRVTVPDVASQRIPRGTATGLAGSVMGTQIIQSPRSTIAAAELQYPPTPPASGIEGLDELLRGGFPRDDLHLITGDAGSGKTTLALQFLIGVVSRPARGLFITLAQTAKGLARDRAHWPWRLLDSMHHPRAVPGRRRGPTEPQTRTPHGRRRAR